MLTGEERMMRTWRALVAVAAAGLLGLASAFVGTGPATAATTWTTWVSVLKPAGATDTKVLEFNGLSDGAPAMIRHHYGIDFQLFTMTLKASTSDSRGIFELRNKVTGGCLDMATDGPVGNGTRVQQWACSGASNQRWVAKPVVSGNNWVKLVNVRSGLCLDVTNVSYTDYATLQVWQCSGNWNQRWNIF
jgi:hypothetical protein